MRFATSEFRRDFGERADDWHMRPGPFERRLLLLGGHPHPGARGRGDRALRVGVAVIGAGFGGLAGALRLRCGERKSPSSRRGRFHESFLEMPGAPVSALSAVFARQSRIEGLLWDLALGLSG